jgi:hypothetical protein
MGDGTTPVLAPGTTPRSDIAGEARGTDDQETDLWWGSYNTRALLPSFVVCGLVTLGVAGVAAYVWAADDENPLRVRYTAYGLAAAVWAFQLLRWGYWVLTHSYRLTTRRVLWQRNFLNVPQLHVALAEIKSVAVDQSALERRLGVGRVHITCTEAGTRELSLEGLLDPAEVARMIRQAMATAAPVHTDSHSR